MVLTKLPLRPINLPTNCCGIKNSKLVFRFWLLLASCGVREDGGVATSLPPLPLSLDLCKKKQFPAIYNLTSGCDGILLIKRLANLNLVLNTYGCLKQRENAKKIAESPNTLPYVSCKLSTWNKQRVGNHSTIY